ncbi:alginate export family protein [Paracoccus sp. (in: a-proteobacteria)]|uniref:alginate export family protein n=1 Tax=Paracoccus sp. TaxID=267 RepID=UPI0026DFB669|nr:alginate export family protein [Paracoccus sp. (in: a-proteobacteria)]MDO5370898.1 alginate export family protein [Paracoccus sp. (in: a-proteobacteria)]
MTRVSPLRLAAALAVAGAAGLPAGPARADDPPELEWTFELTYDGDRRRNLQAGGDDHLSKLVPQLTVEVEQELADDITGHLELELGHDRILDRGAQRDDGHETVLDLKQIFVEFENFRPGLTLLVGRQDFKDDRKWYFDEELDGIRLIHERGALSLDASVTRELLFRKNLLESRPDDEDAINNYFLKAGYEVAEDHDLSAYALIRDGMSGVDEELIFYGLSAQGQLADSLTYWGEFAHLRGRDGDNRLNGWGVDLGATWRFQAAWQPSLTIAYAMGTGDDGGGRDSRFRQSGLEGNEARFNGVEDFLYYGEALNPELSNIRVLTAGIGIRPTENSSIDLVAHSYRQDVAEDGRLPGAAMRAEANGNSRDIGTGIDLIFGYREIEDVALGLRLGWFRPGDAFDGDRTMFSIKAGLDFDF